jgi:CCR4-NOT transcriptional regulation complex NOT5 subunit
MIVHQVIDEIRRSRENQNKKKNSEQIDKNIFHQANGEG